MKAELGARRSRLSPRLREIAELVLSHSNDMALETIAVIAERAQVPPSSLIRFAQALEFDEFTAM